MGMCIPTGRTTKGGARTLDARRAPKEKAMRNATAVFACCVMIAVVPATIRAEASAAELEALIKEFEKLRGRDRAEGAEIILAQIDTFMLEAEKRLDFDAAARFARRGASIARGIKCPRQRDYNLQAGEYNKLKGWLGQVKLLAETLKKKPDNADVRRRLITVYMIRFDNPGAKVLKDALQTR